MIAKINREVKLMDEEIMLLLLYFSALTMAEADFEVVLGVVVVVGAAVVGVVS